MRDDLTQTRIRLQNLESERAVGERIIREYGPGVGLIQGTYAFYDKSSRPLRYRLDADDRIVRDDSGAPVLDHAGTGPVHLVEYFGTGFLVDKKGLLLTNRHVAEPWWNDASAQLQVDKGYSPRFNSFRAFFPQEREPFELEVERLSDSMDLAVVRIETEGAPDPRAPPRQERRGRGGGAARGGRRLSRGAGGDPRQAGQRGGEGAPRGLRHEHGARDGGAVEEGAHPSLHHPGPHRRHHGDATSCSTLPPPREGAGARS